MIHFGGGNPGNSKPATFTAVKPNGMQWELTQEVIKYYEKKVINLVDMTGPENSEEAMKQQRINMQDQPVFPGLVKDTTGGKVVGIVQQALKGVKTRGEMHWENNPVHSTPRPFLFSPSHVVLSWVSQDRQQLLSAEGIQIHGHNYLWDFQERLINSTLRGIWVAQCIK